MKGKRKTLLLLVLSGLLLGISPGTRLYSADDEPECSSNHDHATSVSIQFLLVHVEREMLKEHIDDVGVLTIDSISLETLGQCIHAEEGAEIVSQTKLTVADGIEAEMTVVEHERRKAKNGEEEVGEQNQREAEVAVWLEARILEGNRLAARFTYKRNVVEEGFYASDEAEEEEGSDQKFEISSGIVLHAGQACIAGANMNEEIATFLIVKADLIDHRHEGPARQQGEKLQ
jgi:hypothetical protein